MEPLRTWWHAWRTPTPWILMGIVLAGHGAWVLLAQWTSLETAPFRLLVHWPSMIGLTVVEFAATVLAVRVALSDGRTHWGGVGVLLLVTLAGMAIFTATYQAFTNQAPVGILVALTALYLVIFYLYIRIFTWFLRVVQDGEAPIPAVAGAWRDSKWNVIALFLSLLVVGLLTAIPSFLLGREDSLWVDAGLTAVEAGLNLTLVVAAWTVFTHRDDDPDEAARGAPRPPQ